MMKTIPKKHGEELDLHALRVLDALFRERGLWQGCREVV
jgi:hypothetical protein